MGKKLLKSGKIVVLTAGRYAGRKAIVVKTFDEGAGTRKYAHAIVAGIDKYPKKVTRKMSNKKVGKRSHIKPFVRFVNFNHILPTRYQVELDVKKLTLTGKDGKAGESINLDETTLVDATQRNAAKKAIKQLFETGYKSYDDATVSAKSKAGELFFYQKLRF